MNHGKLRKGMRFIAAAWILLFLFTAALPAPPAMADESPSINEEPLSTPTSGLSWQTPIGIGPNQETYSYTNHITPDGRYIGYINSGPDRAVSILDRQTGTTVTAGTQPDLFSMSDDAQIVAYTSGSNPSQVYIYDGRDASNPTTTLISSLGDDPVGGDHPAVSGNGSYVAFETDAPLTDDDVNDETDVYVYDVANRTYELISKPAIEEDSEDYGTWPRAHPSISADGRYVAFDSGDSYLVEGDDDFYGSIFLYDRTTKIMKLITPADDHRNYINPSISADGKTIVFENDDMYGDGNNVFVAQVDAGTVEQVTFDAIPDGYYMLSALKPRISPDGSYAIYGTAYRDGDYNNFYRIYVADLNSHAVTQAAFATPPYDGLYSFQGPAISNGARSIVFKAEYTDGRDLVSNVFVADQAGIGFRPEWPEGAELAASDVGTDRVTLSWLAASDASGISGYRLYRDGTPIDFVDAPAVSRTVTGLLPETEYSFEIEAVNVNGNVSANRLSAHATTTADTEHAHLSWTPERTTGSTAALGSNIILNATGPAGLQAAAAVTYSTWFDDAHQLLAEPRSVTEDVYLTATGPEAVSYAGTFPLAEGITEVSAISLSLTDGEGVHLTDDAVGLPAAVSGGVKIGVTHPASVDLYGAQLQAWSAGLSSANLQVTGEGPYLLSGLLPGEGYQTTLRDDTGGLLAKLAGLSVRSGLYTSAALTVPDDASLILHLQDLNGDPAPNVGVEVWDPDFQHLYARMFSDENGEAGVLSALEAGADYVLRFKADDTPYESLSNAAVTLTAGANEKTVTLTGRKNSTLKGTVTDPSGQPVLNAIVTATQKDPVTGKSSSVWIRSDLNGQYQLNLQPGNATVQVTATERGLYSDSDIPVTMERLGTTTKDIPLHLSKDGNLVLTVYTQQPGEPEQGPIDLSQAGLILKIYSKNQSLYNGPYYKNVYNVKGAQGVLTVCLSNSTVYSRYQVCQDADFSQQAQVPLEFHLVSTAPVVKGRLQNNLDRPYRIMVYRDGPEGLLGELVGTDVFSDSDFSLALNDSGEGDSYTLDLIQNDPYHPNESLTFHKQFTFNGGQIVDIGAIAPTTAALLSSSNASRFSASANRIAPGGTIGLSAQLLNGNEKPVTDAHLLVTLPAGLTPVTDSGGRVALTGTDASAIFANRVLDIPLGTIAAHQTTTQQLTRIGWQIQADADFYNPSVSLDAQLTGTYDGQSLRQTLGTVLLQMPSVTMDVPDLLRDPNPVVSGYAPPGAAVEVYDGEVRIGSAAASPVGFWKAQVTLVDEGAPSVHRLRSQAAQPQDGKLLQSPESFVTYDPGAPQLVQAAFAQVNSENTKGKWVIFNPDEGVARMPYTVFPGDPFLFELQFANPDKVRNVQVYMDGQSGPPVTARLEDGLFRATVPTEYGGEYDNIYVSYDTVDDEQPAGSDRTMDEIRASLPKSMRDFEIESVSPFELRDGQYENSVVLKLPQVDGMKITVTTRIKPNSAYRPTEAEIAQAESSGSGMLNFSYDAKATDFSVTNTMSGYIPMSEAFPDGIAALSATGAASALTASAVQGKGATVRALADNGVDYEDLAEFSVEVHSEITDEIEPISEFTDTYDTYMGFAQKVNKIMWAADLGGCFSQDVNIGKQVLVALSATIYGEVAKTALSAWQGAMGLEGPTSLAADFIAEIASNQIDNYVDSKISEVGTGYNSCKGPQPEPLEFDEWTGLPRLKLQQFDENKYLRKLAEPKWIYDPSGYVYEAVPSNRLEDVQATALQQDPDTGEWNVWDASPYAQTNPMDSDGQGSYGWDVPAGKWKVKWEKVGYEPAYSAELDVPPPQTEVHGSLISYAPPQVESVRAVVASDGGSTVDITFSKYLKTAGIGLANAVEVLDAGGSAVAGTAEFADTEEAGDGSGLLSRTIRFTPDAALTVGAAYTVRIGAASIVSYADIAMTQDYAGTATAAVKDETGPRPVSAEWQNGYGVIQVAFDEPLGSGWLNPDDWTLDGQTGRFSSAVAYSPDRGGMPTSVLLTLIEPADPGVVAAAGLALGVKDGAVRDAGGNGAVAASLPVGVPEGALSTDASLGSLSVDGGQLSPAFTAGTTEYTLTVETGATQVRLTAAAADAGAGLFIQGLAAAGGTARTVSLPSDGVITVKVQAEDPTQTRVYTLTVVRSDAPDGPPGGPSDPGGGGTPSTGGDLHDLGSGAKLSRTTSDGRTLLEWSVPTQAVKDALSAAGTTNEAYYVQTDEAADEYAVVIPPEAYRLLADQGATFRFQTPAVQLQFAAGDFDVPADAESVRITVSADVGQTAAEWLTKLEAGGGKWSVLDGGFTIGLEAVTGDAVQPLGSAANKRAVSVAWKAAGDAEWDANALVYQVDPAGGTWTYVPSRTESANGGQLVFASGGSGVYALLGYASGFADIGGHWAQQDIDWMAARGYVTGYSPDAFRPQQAVTRAEFTALLVRLLGLDTDGAAGDSEFADVPSGSWYAGAVNAAVQAGLIRGTGGGRFEPNALLTREQMAALVWRAYQFADGGKDEGGALSAAEQEQLLLAFADRARISGWAGETIAEALKAGLVQGQSASSFNPGGQATRAEAASILRRLAGRLQ